MKRRISALALCAAFACGAARAADLPLKSPPPVYVPPAPVFTWSGLYGGLNIGGGWCSNSNNNNWWGGGGGGCGNNSGNWNWGWNNNNNDRGYVIGGGQVGYNYMFSPMFLLGAETDFQGASGNLEWLGTVRGRIGVVPFNPNLLIYGTGGFAYGQTHDQFNNGFFGGFGPFGGPFFVPGVTTPGVAPFGGLGLAGLAFLNNNNNNQVKTGWTAGGGVEWAFTPNLSAKIEYLYVQLYNNNNNNGFFGGGGCNNGFFGGGGNCRNSENIVRVGINYHWSPAPVPVVAKY